MAVTVQDLEAERERVAGVLARVRAHGHVSPNEVISLLEANVELIERFKDQTQKFNRAVTCR